MPLDPEAEFKRGLVKLVLNEGGYARRIEDKYAVGVPDVIVVYPNLGAHFIEVKMAPTTQTAYGCRPRQLIEARRITDGGGSALLLGVKLDKSEMALSPPTTSTKLNRECMREPAESFRAFLKRYLDGGVNEDD